MAASIYKVIKTSPKCFSATQKRKRLSSFQAFMSFVFRILHLSFQKKRKNKKKETLTMRTKY